MSKLKWDLDGERGYEYGVDHGVLYIEDPNADPVDVHYDGSELHISTCDNPNLLTAANSSADTWVTGAIDDETGEEIDDISGYPTIVIRSLSILVNRHHGELWFVDSNRTYSLFDVDCYMYDESNKYLGHAVVYRTPSGYSPPILFKDIEVNEKTHHIRITMNVDNPITYNNLLLLYKRSAVVIHFDSPLNLMKFGSNYCRGVAWNGLTAVTESPDGAEPNDLWADNIKYASMRSTETFKGTIEAYTSPDDFHECDGSSEPIPGLLLGQQRRKPFSFAYRTRTESEDHCKIHIVYNATASPSERNYETLNDSPDAISFSWEISTTPVTVENHSPISTLVIDSAKVSESAFKAVESLLFGDDTWHLNPTLLPPELAIRIAGSEEVEFIYESTEDVPEIDISD